MNGPRVDNMLNLELTSCLPKDVIQDPLDYNTGQDLLTWHTWPGELSDAMTWSAQFLDPAEMVNHNGASSSAAEMPKYASTEGGDQHQSFS